MVNFTSLYGLLLSKVPDLFPPKVDFMVSTPAGMVNSVFALPSAVTPTITLCALSSYSKLPSNCTGVPVPCAVSCGDEEGKCHCCGRIQGKGGGSRGDLRYHGKSAVTEEMKETEPSAGSGSRARRSENVRYTYDKKRVCGTDRPAECGKVHVDECVDRSEDRCGFQQGPDHQKKDPDRIYR